MVATGAFVCNDTIMKLVLERVPLSQAIFLRGLIACALIAALAAVTGKLYGARRAASRRVVIRGVFEIGATFLFLFGLRYTSLPSATAIVNTTPLVMTLIAALFLGERVGVRRWSAIVVGFAGVLLIVRPGVESFNVYALIIVAATFSVAMRDILTRGIDPNVPSMLVTLVTTVMVTAAGGVAALAIGEWQALALGEIAMLAVAAGFVLVGIQFIIIAFRIGEVSATAPFRYSVILWALLLGYVVWGNVPGIAAIAGIALITGSGLYVFHREYRLGRGVVTVPKR